MCSRHCRTASKSTAGEPEKLGAASISPLEFIQRKCVEIRHNRPWFGISGGRHARCRVARATARSKVIMGPLVASQPKQHDRYAIDLPLTVRVALSKVR